jgi:hypothetical protein
VICRFRITLLETKLGDRMQFFWFRRNSWPGGCLNSMTPPDNA